MAGLTLAIETSNPSCAAGVAIGSRAGGVLGVEAVAAGDGRHDDLMSAIDRLTKRVGIGPRDIGRVGVSIGPGGYTALRIAVAAAKMMCEALGASCVAIPTSRVVARRVKTAGPFAVILASKDETAFATVFAGPGGAGDEGRLIDAAGVRGLGVRTIVADRFLPAAITAAARELGMAVIEPEFNPVACLELSFDSAEIDPLALAPLYPREPEAVTKWRARHGR